MVYSRTVFTRLLTVCADFCFQTSVDFRIEVHRVRSVASAQTVQTRREVEGRELVSQESQQEQRAGGVTVVARAQVASQQQEESREEW